MKSSMTRWMIAAAALAAAAGTASAQRLEANIELTFRAGSTVMQPGHYEITVGPMNHVARLYNVDTKESVMVTTTEGNDASKEWRARRTPMIAFACTTGSRCVLTRLWNGQDATETRFHSREKGHGEDVAEVLVPLTRAD